MSVTKTLFDTMPDGREVYLYTIENNNGISAGIITRGATLQSFNCPDKEGKMGDIIMGFDKVAERIYKYPQVSSLYLMSGAYDLSVVIEGKTMKEVALFVAQKLAPMELVISTATHFVLKKYKEEGVIFKPEGKDSRQVITL